MRRSFALWLSLLATLPTAASSVVEFTAQEAKKIGWTIVNDGVMGGRSKGRYEITDRDTLRFHGNLSLENNGGFSSLRSGPVNEDLSAASGLVLRVKGDGRRYQCRLGTDETFRGLEMAFKATFPTQKDTWTEVQIPFEQFQGTWRGRDLPKKRFDPAKIKQLGLLLADKQAGPFELEVDWIRTYGEETAASSDLVATALADGRFTVLAKALGAAELTETLQKKGPFTVFAPTDEAFAKLPKKKLQNLLKPANRRSLQAILKYHAVAGSVGLADALQAGSAPSLLGPPLAVSFSSGRVRVQDAALVDADIACANGVIHVIDTVLLPPKPPQDLASIAKRAGTFSTLLAAAEAAGLADALAGSDPLTILAPTDQAFAALPEGTLDKLLKPANRDQLKQILTLHVIPGKVRAGDALNLGETQALGGKLRFRIEDGRVRVNQATLQKADIQAENGIIHVLDAVLLPPADQPKKNRKKSPPEASSASLTPAKQIESAIARGVPTFNRGDHAGCAEIYMQCMTTLAQDSSLDPELRENLQQLVKRLEKVESPTRQAWLLRGGLDHAYLTLQGD